VVSDVRALAPDNPVVFAVTGPPEVRRAEDRARRLAAELGFSAEDCAEIALVVVELGSNLVRHAGGGELRMEVVEVADQQGLRVESVDRGPGFADFEHATTDGYSSAGSLGTGLGTVNRLMDDLQYHPLPGGGSWIACTRWLRTEPRIPDGSLEIAGATRAYRQLAENGDAFIVRQWGHHALLGVIDGLGHGLFAQRAAQTARQYIDQHYDQPLEAIFRGVARACQSTRGVVMALVLLDHDRRSFKSASIGNIELRAQGSPERVRFLPQRGVVGQLTPLPRTEEHPWTRGMILIMHSDGIRSTWEWSDLPSFATESPAVIAQRLMSSFGRPDDDATVLVVKNVRP
jgi:anti-sigma regulatory factor (Ser/Thr protein kinase)/serine/threonine protein phosphatase PrpC